MFSAPRRLAVLAGGVAALFVIGLTQLFLLRFEAGDVYPAYSSLRTDPLGTRVLFESLNRLAENSVRRNYRAPDQITLTPRTTLLICGLNGNGAFLDSEKIRRLMDEVAVSGGRLVLTFSSRLSRSDVELEDKADGQDGNCSETPAEPAEEPADDFGETSADEWLGAESLGFNFMRARRKEMEDTAFRSDPVQDSLPVEIPWRTNLFFELADEDWQILYTWRDEAVVVQRSWGRGTVVMSSDSYLFSNEALRSHRYTDFLAWLITPGHTVIFDEYHHGLAHRPGIATLARKYRLQGVFAALMGIAALLIWRQAAVFAPPVRTAEESSGPAPGRNTGQGLVDLTRRHIPTRELLTVCFQTWKLHRAQGVPEALVNRVRELVREAHDNPRESDPVKVYRNICELLKQGKRP